MLFVCRSCGTVCRVCSRYIHPRLMTLSWSESMLADAGMHGSSLWIGASVSGNMALSLQSQESLCVLPISCHLRSSVGTAHKQHAAMHSNSKDVEVGFGLCISICSSVGEQCVAYLKLVWQLHEARFGQGLLALLQLLLQLVISRQDSRKMNPSMQQFFRAGVAFQGCHNCSRWRQSKHPQQRLQSCY